MSVVHDAVQAVGHRSHGRLRAAAAVLCCCALLAGCGSSRDSKPNDLKRPVDYSLVPGVGTSIRSATCTDWERGPVDQRRSTVIRLRKFAGGPIGSSAGIQNGPVLNDAQAYELLQSYCANRLARGFKLYKLYERAAAFIGH
jgi:hypothetical protein